jgi:hypothetical protein
MSRTRRKAAQLQTYTDGLSCDTCTIHAYGVMHLCLDHGRAISHSQGDCDAHRTCCLWTCSSVDWRHGDTTDTFVDRLIAMGVFGPWVEEWAGSEFERRWGRESHE